VLTWITRVFVDESGVNIGMARLFARSIRGERAVGKIPRNTGENVSVIGALSLDGLIATMSVKGSVDRDVFLTYLSPVLLPQLWPGAIVFMPLVVQFSDLELSSDAGILLARQAEEQVQVCRSLAECIQEWRDPTKITHSLNQLVSQRVYQLVGGYEDANDSIALRNHVRTTFERSIYTITKVVKFVPSLPHPIFEHKPPMLNLVQIGRIGRQVPELTSSFCYDFINALGVVKPGIIDDDDIAWVQLRYKTLL
jgi:hypothetical protein